MNSALRRTVLQKQLSDSILDHSEELLMCLLQQASWEESTVLVNALASHVARHAHFSVPQREAELGRYVDVLRHFDARMSGEVLDGTRESLCAYQLAMHHMFDALNEGEMALRFKHGHLIASETRCFREWQRLGIGCMHQRCYSLALIALRRALELLELRGRHTRHYAARKRCVESLMVDAEYRRAEQLQLEQMFAAATATATAAAAEERVPRVDHARTAAAVVCVQDPPGHRPGPGGQAVHAHGPDGGSGDGTGRRGGTGPGRMQPAAFGL